jgi:adenylate cyclase
MDALRSPDILLFGPFRFDRRGSFLFRRAEDGRYQPVSLGSRALTVLGVLTERPGDLVTKDEIMCAVWPGTVVEESNLTVQISTLRRILDAGSEGDSCIQTVSGRGYRFVLPTTRPAGTQSDSVLMHSTAVGSAAEQDRRQIIEERMVRPPNHGIAETPRLSLAVLPFKNLGGDANEDYFADAITEDLTTNLSRLPGALVIARTSAAFYMNKSVDVRRVGQELGVRYVVEGSARRLGETLRVNVQLIATETGTHLWAGRFDQDIRDLCVGQDEIANRLSAELGVQVVEAETARSTREHSRDPDAFDLFLRARSAFRNQSAESIGLYEQALQLDPSSARVMILLARELINRYLNTGPNTGNPDLIDRADSLISTAGTIEPNTEHVIFATGFLLRAQARHAEAIAVLQQLAERAPNNSNAFRQLGICMIAKGRAGEAVPHLRRSIRLDPLTPNHRFTCNFIGQALAMLGHDAEAAGWHQQALAATARDTPQWRATCYLFMASAYGLLDQPLDARHALAEANRLWPYATLRSFRPIHPGPCGSPDPAILVQMRRIQEGLRLAGLRDHADEAVDFGLPETGELRTDLTGRTPTSVPGATTIRTSELADLIKRQTPILIDVALGSWGRSVPGAVGLQGTGLGVQFSDVRQTRFSHKIRDLTSGDLAAPIVVFGANSERFTGYNLALRLVALGYTQVHWYRGGFEAWQVNGLPETEVDVQEW